MTRVSAAEGPAGLVLRMSAPCLLALVLCLVMGASAGEATGPDDRTPTVVPTLPPTPTPSPTAKPPPTAMPSPTAQPAHDLAVLFFNNFCEKDQPLLVTIFNSNVAAMPQRIVHVRLMGEGGLIEQQYHQLSLPGLGSVNLPLENMAQPPWVQVEVDFLDSPDDPNMSNNSVSCGVTDPAAPVVTEPQPPAAAVSRVTAPPASGGAGSDAVWRQAAPSPTAAPATEVQAAQPAATQAPRVAPSTNQRVPQPSLTPTGDAGGGLAAPPQGPFPSRLLMMTGVVLLAAGSSWGFYYLTRPANS